MMFGAINTAATGLTTHRTWLDAVADNIANINVVRSTEDPAFQARHVVAAPIGPRGGDQVGAGVRVAGVVFGDPEGRIMYQPDHPLADEQGLVRGADVDLGQQMVEMMVAQRAYQSNLAVIDRARDAYQQAISIGGR